MLADAKSDGAFFIYLYPLTAAAKATYTTWGYTAPYPNVEQQFLELRQATDKKRVVPERLTSQLRPPAPATLFVEAHTLATNLRDRPLVTLVDRASRTRKTDDAFVARLRDTLETIAVLTDVGDDADDTIDDAGKLQLLHEIFDDTSGGRRRRTRRVRGRRLTKKRKQRRV